MNNNNNNRNHRCSVCDYTAFSTEHDHAEPRTFHYHARRDEYVCSECDDSIFDTLSEFDPVDLDMPLGAPTEAVHDDLDFRLLPLPETENTAVRSNLGLLEASETPVEGVGEVGETLADA